MRYQSSALTLAYLLLIITSSVSSYHECAMHPPFPRVRQPLAEDCLSLVSSILKENSNHATVQYFSINPARGFRIPFTKRLNTCTALISWLPHGNDDPDIASFDLLTITALSIVSTCLLNNAGGYGGSVDGQGAMHKLVVHLTGVASYGTAFNESRLDGGGNESLVDIPYNGETQ